MHGLPIEVLYVRISWLVLGMPPPPNKKKHELGKTAKVHPDELTETLQRPSSYKTLWDFLANFDVDVDRNETLQKAYRDLTRTLRGSYKDLTETLQGN